MSGSSVGSFGLIVFCPGASFPWASFFQLYRFSLTYRQHYAFFFFEILHSFFAVLPSLGDMSAFNFHHFPPMTPLFSRSAFFGRFFFVLPGRKNCQAPFSILFQLAFTPHFCIFYVRLTIILSFKLFVPVQSSHSFVTVSIWLLCLRIQSSLCIITGLLWLSSKRPLRYLLIIVSSTSYIPHSL